MKETFCSLWVWEDKPYTGNCCKTVTKCSKIVAKNIANKEMLSKIYEFKT